MEIKKLNITEKLIELEKKRKKGIIVTKMGSVKISDNSSYSSTGESYSFSDYEQ